MKSLFSLCIMLTLLACQQRQQTQNFRIDEGLANSTFNPNVPSNGNQGFNNQGSNNTDNQNTSSDKPDSSSVSGEWSGAFSRMADVQIQSVGGETLAFSKLQNDKDFLVIGLYDATDLTSVDKAKVFIADQNKRFFQNSKTCQYVGIIQGDVTSNSSMQEFASSYGFQFLDSAKNNIKQSNLASFVAGGNFNFPTTIVVDFDGNVVKSFQNDIGPQTALSYCQ